MSKIYVIAQEVLDSKFEMLFNRINELERKLSMNNKDSIIRIGEVKKILQRKNIKCTDNRTVQRWLEENNIRTQYKKGSTSKYYSKNEVLKCLN